MNQIRSFQYVKGAADISDRVVYVENETHDRINGVDLTELMDADIAAFNTLMGQLSELEMSFKDKVQSLFGEYDLKHRYRCFLKSKIINQEKV